jgi:hypothetical protein
VSRRVLGSIRPRHTLALVLLFAAGCSQEVSVGPDNESPLTDAGDAGQGLASDADSAAADATTARRCAWGVDAILAEVGEAAFAGRGCGFYSYWRGLKAGFDCFESGRAQGSPALLTVNKCADCSNEYTYVASERGELFEIQFENDSFGGDRSTESVIARCDAISFDGSGFSSGSEGITGSSGGDVKCEGRNELYRCSEAPLTRTPPSYPATEPLKISDVPSAPGAQRTTLHLYVSNQSSDDPLVNIRLQIDSLYVVQGYFAVAGQHNWYQFDIELPVGTREIGALTFKPDHAVSLNERVEVPGERWVVVDYWYAKGDKEERFTLHVFDQPVMFE